MVGINENDPPTIQILSIVWWIVDFPWFWQASADKVHHRTQGGVPRPRVDGGFWHYLSSVSYVGSTTMRYQVWEEQWDRKSEAHWNISVFWQVSIFMVWLRSEKPSPRITRLRYRQTEIRFGKRIWNPTIWDKIHRSSSIMVRLGAVLVRVLEISLIYLIRKGHFGTYFQLILGNLFH